MRGGLTPLSGFVKLLIHLVRGILYLSGKSQGKVTDRNFKKLLAVATMTEKPSNIHPFKKSTEQVSNSSF